MAKNSNFDTTAKAKEFTYKVTKKYGVLGKRGNFTLELRKVSFNGKEPQFDLRSWGKKEDGTETMTKGVSMSGDETEKLYEILKGIAEGK